MRILLFVLLPLFSFSQNGSISGDSLKLDNGLHFVKGTSINIGPGSKTDGRYAFIYTAVERYLGQTIMSMPLTSGWAGYKMKILDFKLIGTEIMGKKYYLVLTIDKKGRSKYWCDPVLASAAKEIVIQ